MSRGTAKRTEVETGTVIEVSEGSARVEVSPSSMCAHCKAASSCIPASGGSRLIEVADPVGVSVNERVRIELTSGRLVLASSLAFALPLIGMLAGTAIGFAGGSAGSKDTWCAVGAAAGLAAGLVISKFFGDYLGRHGKFTPVITGLVEPEEKKERER